MADKPRRARTVLLIIDVISDFSFEDAPALLRRLRPAAKRIAALKQRARKARIPAVYVNDNFGNWRSDAEALVKTCAGAGQPGTDVVNLLAPDPDDYFIIKPRHSGFFASGLDALLAYMGASRLILTGVSSHQCVLFTANDAYVREYELKIPRDCIAAPALEHSKLALRYFEMVLGADTRPSSQLQQWKTRQRVRSNRAARAVSGLLSPR